MQIESTLERTLRGLGYELVDFQRAGYGQVRVFIDRPGGVNVDDCAAVSDHLTKLFAVEGYAYERLEVSSPGLDRPLKRAADFARFEGEQAQLKVRVPRNGQRNFKGQLCAAPQDKVALKIGAQVVTFDLADIEKARLVPKFD